MFDHHVTAQLMSKRHPQTDFPRLAFFKIKEGGGGGRRIFDQDRPTAIDEKKNKNKKTLAKTKKETIQLKQANNHAFRNSYRFCIKR